MTPKDVPEDLVQNEKNILLEQMADTGKPPDILEKIVTGRINKFYEQVCLIEQSHMLEEGNPKIRAHLSSLGMQVSAYQASFIQ